MKNYLIAMSFCAAMMLPALASAAPVTLQFEAEVIDVDVLAPADLPFTVENGDILKGQFTFEPVDAETGPFGISTMTDTVQEFSFSLMLDSAIVGTSLYTLQVRDNSPIIDGQSSNDTILLGCSSVGNDSCQPGTVPDTDGIIWFFQMPISADDTALDGADISPDPEVWGQFAGHIALTFQNRGVADVLRIIAQVDKFTVVPEPLSQCLLLPVIVAFFSTRCSIGKR